MLPLLPLSGLTATNVTLVPEKNEDKPIYSIFQNMVDVPFCRASLLMGISDDGGSSKSTPTSTPSCLELRVVEVEGSESSPTK